jgi:uncharacterized protein YigA (DUF484 family)
VSGSPKDAEKAPGEALSPDAVAAWLRRHPDFLAENDDLLAVLTPPELQQGDGVVDLQRFMLERLQGDVGTLRRREKQLISAAEGNAAGQSKVHQAAIALIEARDVTALCTAIRSKLPQLLDIEAAALCIEDEGALSLAGATAIGTGGIANLMGPKRRIVLQEKTAGENIVFGGAAERVKSVAYLRLRTGSGVPNMLLALGSGRDDGFAPNQATDLLAFLGDVLEVRLGQCLGPKT